MYTDLDEGHLVIRKWDNINFEYRFNMCKGWTFEESYVGSYYREVADDVDIYWEVDYTLI